MNKLVLITLFCAICVHSTLVTISNVMPRLSKSTGEIIDAHDGSIQQFTPGGLFYYHAVEYGLCTEPARYGCDQTADHCGFRFNHNISVWTTTDLTNNQWTFAGYAITPDQRPPGTVFRPHLVYNPNTKEYVLWWNYVTPTGQYNGYAVATAPEPTGPFTMRNNQVNITRLHNGAGDFDLFVDQVDGSGYVIYSAGYYISIEKLTPDFVYSTGEQAVCGANGSKLFPEYFVEAPVMFKRGTLYYALFGHCCCFCEQGSGIFVHTAASPMGPWNAIPGNLACRSNASDEVEIVDGIPTPGQGCLYGNSNDFSVTKSQQNFVIEVNTPTGVEYIWTGDRWQQAPDGIKGHEPQYWVPLSFGADGSIEDVDWVDEFQIDIV